MEQQRLIEDLTKHYGGRMRQSMQDAIALFDDHGDKARAALALTSVPIGFAAGVVANAAARRGHKMTDSQAIAAILRILLVTIEEGSVAGTAAFRNALGPT